MSPYVFLRQFRTSTSEGYAIMLSSERLGRVDLHFGTTNVYATIVLERELDETVIARIIEDIDTSLVETANVSREDLHVWVYQGTEVGFYTDAEPYTDEFDDEDEDDDVDDVDEEDDFA